jgi:flagellar biosynthesis protein FlhF
LKVKKFQAVDMSDALQQIKAELGPDAVILSSRQVSRGKGVFGMLGRPILEVTAASDLAVQPPAPAAPPPGAYRTPPAAPPRAPADHGAILSLQADMDSLREELDVLGRRPRADASAVLERDVKALAGKLDQLLAQTAAFERLQLAPGLRVLHAHLEEMDLDPQLTARLLGFLQDKLDAGTLAEGRERAALREVVERTVRVAPDLAENGGGPQVVALVGPTGVGKTTTVAKLAARFALQQERSVGLITLDTFRIGAVEQLKTYANITGVTMRVALDAAGFRDAIEQFSGRDIVLVDTAGQSPRDEESLAELLTLFPAEVKVEVHLVLSVTTRSRDLERILRHYAPVKASRLLLTKLDETTCHGALFGLPVASRLPLSYLTTGQNVPDDIEIATPRGVADYLLRAVEEPR